MPIWCVPNCDNGSAREIASRSENPEKPRPSFFKVTKVLVIQPHTVQIRQTSSLHPQLMGNDDCPIHARKSKCDYRYKV